MLKDDRFIIETLPPVTEGSPLTVKFTRVDTTSVNENIRLSVKFGSDSNYETERLLAKGQQFDVNIAPGTYQQTLSIMTGDDATFRADTKFFVEARSDNQGYANEAVKRYGNLLENDPNPVRYFDVTFTQPEVAAYEGDTLRIGLKLNTKDHNGVVVPHVNLRNPSGPNTISPYVRYFDGSEIITQEGNGHFVAKFAPGSDYTELVFQTRENNIVEGDRSAFVGYFTDGLDTDQVTLNSSYRSSDNSQFGMNKNNFIRIMNTSRVTLLDDDITNPTPIPTFAQPQGAPAPAITTVINNIYNDNRVFINSFNTTTNNTFINSFNGTMERDELTGTSQADEMLGYKGDDLIRGGAGDDLLRGGQGNDTLFGGRGLNTLAGGKGSDIFNVLSEQIAASADIIRGFEAGERINMFGATNLTFQQMDNGVGIFNNGVMEALVAGNNTVDTVSQYTFAL